jgi:octaprenyl-diphosphate synthase
VARPQQQHDILTGKGLPQFARKLALQAHFNQVRDDLRQVEIRLRQQADSFDPEIHGYVAYATATNGKRIRPALTLLAARATGGSTAAHIDLAAVVELIHLASLIHDDVLDHAQLRRAKPTVNSKWGAELSVLLGDCLFAHALQLCSRFADQTVCRLVADAANEVCTGEILQTQRRFDLKLSPADYFKIVAMKTGALFRVSTELAAHLNQQPPDTVAAYRVYGDSIGVAYQIYDDCLDLFGSEDGSGKTLGTDLKKGKLTLPLLHALQQLDGPRLAAVTATLLHGSDDDRAALKTMVVELGGHVYAARQAREYLERAARRLESLPVNAYAETLQTIARTFAGELAELQ